MSSWHSDDGRWTSLVLLYIHAISTVALLVLSVFTLFGIFFAPVLGTLSVQFPTLDAASISVLFSASQPLNDLLAAVTPLALSAVSGQRITSGLFCFALEDPRDTLSQYTYGCSGAYGFNVPFIIKTLAGSGTAVTDALVAAVATTPAFAPLRSYQAASVAALWIAKLFLAVPIGCFFFNMLYIANAAFRTTAWDRRAYRAAQVAFICAFAGAATLLAADVTALALVNKNFAHHGFSARLSAPGMLVAWFGVVGAAVHLYLQHTVLHKFDGLRAAMAEARRAARDGEYDDCRLTCLIEDDDALRVTRAEAAAGLVTERRAKEERRLQKAAQRAQEKAEKKAEEAARCAAERAEQEQRAAERRAQDEQRAAERQAKDNQRAVERQAKEDQRAAERQALDEKRAAEQQARIEEQARARMAAAETQEARDAARARKQEAERAERKARREEQDAARRQRDLERAYAKERARSEAVMVAEARARAEAERRAPAYTEEDVVNDTSSFYAANEIRRHRDASQRSKSAGSGYPQSYEPSRH